MLHIGKYNYLVPDEALRSCYETESSGNMLLVKCAVAAAGMGLHVDMTARVSSYVC